MKTVFPVLKMHLFFCKSALNVLVTLWDLIRLFNKARSYISLPLCNKNLYINEVKEAWNFLYV